ncbi:MAG TPA: hypothetical protein VK465_09055 [Fibrobacteria bacterium]|nr:hypothetical protein [Fibrobacteria bacterium]
MSTPTYPPRLLPVSLLAIGLAAGASRAQGKYTPDLVKEGDRWTITFHDDSSPVHSQWATQGLCFRYAGIVGTHQRYVWWSDTYPDWNGMATQEGDEVTMHGDYAEDVGHDGMKWEIVTSSPKQQGAGHWWEWRENGSYGNTIGWGNARLERVGSCRIAFENARYLKVPLDEKGWEMRSPMGNLPELTIQPDIK